MKNHISPESTGIMPTDKENRPGKKTIRKVFAIALPVLVSIIGLLIATYPIWSEAYLKKVRSQVESQYHEIVNSQDETEILRLFDEAREYNEKLARGEIDLLDPGASGYFDILTVPGTKVMAYVSIPRLGIELPVYHGVGADALDKGCGHMAQSSFPIGGATTHSIISAHTGMASSPMFSDLEQMVPGDIFQIRVLNMTLTYQVQSQADIRVVLPDEITSISFPAGEDLVTLVTCTPFGVNSHRLLVTGHRIENPPEEEVQQQAQSQQEERPKSVYREHYRRAFLYAGIFLAAGIVTIIVIRVLQSKLSKKGDKQGGRHERQV